MSTTRTTNTVRMAFTPSFLAPTWVLGTAFTGGWLRVPGGGACGLKRRNASPHHGRAKAIGDLPRQQ